LYFFYEMTDTKKERRKETQKLFRIRKNSTGSKILEMKYEEIQNDYHSYWFVIKDQEQNPALIANCMRNIIEYFFNFVEKQDLNNVFQKPSMQANKFQSFCRYVNRESHSLGQNIFDIKEFNYDDFREAFRLVFIENGYEEHYKKMTK
jgi:wobble nucleotide-excising tRNase